MMSGTRTAHLFVDLEAHFMEPSNVVQPPPTATIHVSMAVDRGFELPLAVSLLSLAEVHSLHGVPCQVSVLSSGLGPKTQRYIEQDVEGRVVLDWVDVDVDRLTGASYTSGLSNASLFRLLLPELLPASRERTIYLDADTLVRQPLTELWQTDLGDNLLAAVRDSSTPYSAGPAGTKWRELGISPGADYFNSGVLVLPLDRWREQGIAESTLSVLRTSKPPWGDQCALNVVAQHRWLELPRRWNVQTADAEERGFAWALWPSDVEDAVSNPAVIHYTEPRKPWTGRADHPFGDLWFATLERSSWANWRPPTKTRRALGRFVRAGRVLRYG